MKCPLLSKTVFVERRGDCSLQGLRSCRATVLVLPEILALPGAKQISPFLGLNLAFAISSSLVLLKGLLSRKF